jgi:hypothetical protein
MKFCGGARQGLLPVDVRYVGLVALRGVRRVENIRQRDG